MGMKQCCVGGPAKMTCFLKMNMQFGVEKDVSKGGDWLFTVSQVLDALKKINHLQCKAKTHISERTYFYKMTVSCQFTFPVWFVIGKK